MPMSPKEFAAIWNNIQDYPTLADVALTTGLANANVASKKASLLRARRADGEKLPRLVLRSGTIETPIPETRNTFHENMTEETCLQELRSLYHQDPDRNLTRNYFRSNTNISDSTWTRYFGTFLEFKRQAGLELNRNQHAVERQVARHVSADHYRDYNERRDYSDKYQKDAKRKIRTIIGVSDLHDEEIDPFYLRVFIQTCKMLQPDVINLGGDIFDLAEFGKYGVDPREWDVVGKIKFVHNNILAPLREVCPDAQIDFVEGNHEYRLLRHLADATPALRAVLSDLLGLTVSKLLGLDDFQINYISKADLAAFSKKSQEKEVGKSYVIYNDALLVHHHPHAAQWGLPGWNGHHHCWKVSHHKSALKGGYQWMQLGCGHRTKASYTEGEFWSMGFNIAHLNTETGTTTMEYVNVTDLACVGGVYFYRSPSECYGIFKAAAYLSSRRAA